MKRVAGAGDVRLLRGRSIARAASISGSARGLPRSTATAAPPGHARVRRAHRRRSRAARDRRPRQRRSRGRRGPALRGRHRGRRASPAPRRAIYAIGDCTRFPRSRYGRKIRLECVQNAIDQAKAVAAAIIGKPQALRSGAVVLVGPVRDQAADRRPARRLRRLRDRRRLRPARKFSVEYRKAGKLIAVDAVNDGRAHMLGRRRIAGRTAGGASACARLSSKRWRRSTGCCKQRVAAGVVAIPERSAGACGALLSRDPDRQLRHRLPPWSGAS